MGTSLTKEGQPVTHPVEAEATTASIHLGWTAASKKPKMRAVVEAAMAAAHAHKEKDKDKDKEKDKDKDKDKDKEKDKDKDKEKSAEERKGELAVVHSAGAPPASPLAETEKPRKAASEDSAHPTSAPPSAPPTAAPQPSQPPQPPTTAPAGGEERPKSSPNESATTASVSHHAHPPLVRRNSLRDADFKSSALGERSESSIFRFVLTGGPCGGKTTAIVRVADRLRSLGLQVYVVPEMATMFMTSGVVIPSNPTESDLLAWESQNLRAQMAIEDAFIGMAQHTKKPTVLLCDRGTMDVKAYLDRDLWSALISMNNWSAVYLRDQRYDGVVHLVTAADGAAEFYTLANNKARRESPEQAIALDHKTRDAWLGHSRVAIVDNSQQFDVKMNRVLQLFCNWLGFPAPEMRRKFLVEIDVETMSEFPVEHQDCVLTSTFLRDPDHEVVLRKRGQDGNFWYSVSVRQLSTGTTIQRPIDATTYMDKMKLVDPSLTPVVRQRRSFVYSNQYMEIDYIGIDFKHPDKPLRAILIVEKDDSGPPIEMPQWVKIVKRLDNDEVLKSLAKGVSVEYALASSE